MNLAVIPARGGSKRIPRKNIKIFSGKPIIGWSIEAAIECGCFDKVIVSTDDDEIANVAREYGAEVPFKRPAELSDDNTGTIPVIHNAIDQLEKLGQEYDKVCCIYATAPFITSSDLLKGLELLEKEDCAYTFSVASFSSPIQRAFYINKSNRVEMFYPEYFHTRSQDLKEAYHDAGQYYWGRVAAWKKEISFFTTESMPVVIPRYRVQDIDSQEDWVQAELLFKTINQTGDENEL